MPKIPTSLNNLKMFLSPDKIEKIVPLFKGLENDTKSLIGQNRFDVLQGIGDGILRGDILNGIVDTASLKNEEKILNKLRDNYLEIQKQFIGLLEDASAQEYINTINKYVETAFPEKECRNVLSDLKVFLENKRSPIKKTTSEPQVVGGEPQSLCSNCSDARIVLQSLTESEINTELCNEIYKKFCCDLNNNEDVENVIKSSGDLAFRDIVIMINDMLNDDMVDLRKMAFSVMVEIQNGNKLNESVDGGAPNPAALLGALGKIGNMGSKTNKMTNIVDSAMSMIPISSTSDGETPGAKVDTSLAPQDKYVFDKYKNVLQLLLNENFKIKCKEIAIKLHDLTYKTIDEYYPYNIIETNIQYFAIAILLNDPQIFFSRRITQLDHIVQLAERQNVVTGSIEEIESLPELTDYIVKDVCEIFTLRIVEGLPKIVNHYREVIVRRMNILLEDLLIGGVVGGGGRKTRRRQRKGRKSTRKSSKSHVEGRKSRSNRRLRRLTAT